MLIPATIISVIFGSLGFIVTKNNARYILSGYNTMSDQQRSLVDIDRYLRFFKKFHLFLGFSTFVLVMGTNLFSSNLAAIILGVYPLLAYVYFILKSAGHFYVSKNNNKWIGVGILLLTICGVGYLFSSGFEDNRIILEKDNLEITGMYGEKISRDKILDVKLVSELPEIKMKSNGFGAGDFRKGFFKTKDRKTVKLFMNKTGSPILLLNTVEGDIYFCSREEASQDLFLQVEKWRSL